MPHQILTLWDGGGAADGPPYPFDKNNRLYETVKIVNNWQGFSEKTPFNLSGNML